MNKLVEPQPQIQEESGEMISYFQRKRSHREEARLLKITDLRPDKPGSQLSSKAQDLLEKPLTPVSFLSAEISPLMLCLSLSDP